VTAAQPVQQQIIRVEKGQLFAASGVFQVSRIDGTKVMDRWFRPAGPGCVFVVLGLACSTMTLVLLLAGLFVVTAEPGTVEWFGQLVAMSMFVGPCLVMATVFFVIHVKAQPKTSYWHELEIWISGTRHVIAAWHTDPLWAIQREIAAAQRDLEYVGPPIYIGYVNQVSGNNNAANFGGHGNSAQTGGAEM
jgi:hypothetical protein